MRERCGERLSEVPFNLRASMSSYDLAIKRNKIALDSILNISGKSVICDSSKDVNVLMYFWKINNLKFELFILYVMEELLCMLIDANMEVGGQVYII